MTRPGATGRPAGGMVAGAAPQPLVGKRLLFVAGPPRSGTTAVAEMLNADDRFAVGIERFKLVRDDLAPAHFTAERFFSPTVEETRPHLLLPDLYEQLRRRWERRGQLDYVGDKYPLYALMLAELAERFPGCRVVYVFRDPIDVARSAEVFAAARPDADPPRPSVAESVRLWNDCGRAVRRFVESADASRLAVEVHVVGYRELLAGPPTAHRALYGFLGLPITPRAVDALERFRGHWSRFDARRRDLPAARAAEVGASVDEECLGWLRSRLA